MSQSAWPPRAPALAPYRPEMLIGAASPLWAYFGGAAVAGVAWWWMTRWTREGFGAAWLAAEPALEVMGEATRQAEDAAKAAEAVVEPAWEAMAEVVGGPVGEALAGEATPGLPVGGEAAPFGAAALEAELIEDPSLAAAFAPVETRELAPDAPRPPRSRKPKQDGEPKPH